MVTFLFIRSAKRNIHVESHLFLTPENSFVDKLKGKDGVPNLRLFSKGLSTSQSYFSGQKLGRHSLRGSIFVTFSVVP